MSTLVQSVVHHSGYPRKNPLLPQDKEKDSSQGGIIVNYKDALNV